MKSIKKPSINAANARIYGKTFQECWLSIKMPSVWVCLLGLDKL